MNVNSSILSKLANEAKERVEREKSKISLNDMKDLALSLPKGDFAFFDALKGENLSFICECKKASPSKGIIDDDFAYLDIARDYLEAGADAISVLTEPKWFLGSDIYLEQIAKSIYLPCLRKDFIVDVYMIYQAKLLGASAILLICAILDSAKLQEFLLIADSLGLDCLVETHNKDEIEMALGADSRIIGVNNRNLADFSLDYNNAKTLREYIPSDVLFVAESGINDALAVKNMRDIGANAVLIGEALMRANSKKAKLEELKSLL